MALFTKQLNGEIYKLSWVKFIVSELLGTDRDPCATGGSVVFHLRDGIIYSEGRDYNLISREESLSVCVTVCVDAVTD